MLEGYRTSAGLRGQQQHFWEHGNALGFVIVVLSLKFSVISACLTIKEHALPTLLTPSTYWMGCVPKRHASAPCALPQPVPGGGQWLTAPCCGKGGCHEDSHFDQAGHAGNPCQVASDLQLPHSSLCTVQQPMLISKTSPRTPPSTGPRCYYTPPWRASPALWSTLWALIAVTEKAADALGCRLCP